MFINLFRKKSNIEMKKYFLIMNIYLIFIENLIGVLFFELLVLY
jgi:hypothetical protein